MSARLLAIEKGLTGIARKVLEAVPIADTWSVTQLLSELRRAGHTSDHKLVSGCLSSLVDTGLVREPVRGSFKRVNIAPKPAQPSLKAVPSSDAAATPATPDPMDRAISLAAQVRALASSAIKIATELDDLALEVEGRIQQVEAGAKQFCDAGNLKEVLQLQELLNSIAKT